jgi:glutamyl-tRNA(Gln) amidotransferase subunit E
MIDTVEKEMTRQHNILKLKSKIAKYKSGQLKDLTKVFDDCSCKMIQKAFDKKDGVFGFKVFGFNGLLGQELQPNKRLATDFSDYAKPVAKIGGIIHSDEDLNKYSFSQDEIDDVKKKLNMEKNDAFILIIGSEEKAKLAREQINNRAKLLGIGVPMEVRQSNPDGTTSFLRPMPGAARMYPETDLPLLRIHKKEIDFVKNNLPKLASENRKYLKEFGLNDELIKLILKNKKSEEFAELVSATDYYSLAAKMLLIFPKEFAKKEKKDLKEIEEILHMDALVGILEKVPEEISPNEVKDIMYSLVKGKTFEEALKRESFDLAGEVKLLIKEKPGLSVGAYMGLLMKKFAGMVNGKALSEEIKKQLV